MKQPTTKAQIDANRTANNIARNEDDYQYNPVFKWMVDNTQYFTWDEQIESMGIIGVPLTRDEA